MRPDSAVTNPAYHEALHWLYGLSPNVRTAAQIVADHPRKLDRMRGLLDRLGRPEQAFASVLVAGTKGKGSIAAFAESILRAAGWRTGLVTSPHLVSWCERTRLLGADISPAEAARLIPAVRAAVDRLMAQQPEVGPPTTFEAGLAVSLLAFAEAGVRLAVVEVGVGGLHDATNVLDPLAVALGPISYDHTGTLGQTLTAIATEKAGIFRPERLAVSAIQPAEAWAVVERSARERGAILERIGREWRWHPDDDRPCRGRFTVAGPRGQFGGLTTPLLGRHQRENATAAVALATGVMATLGPGTTRALTLPRGHQSEARRRPVRARGPGGATGRPEGPWGSRGPMHGGGPVYGATGRPEGRGPVYGEGNLRGGGSSVADACAVGSAVRSGLASVRWPGRLQVLRERPWLVIDGAHNGDSAGRLVEALGECFTSRRYHLVFGTSVGKDVPRMLDALLPGAQTVTLTRSHHERAVQLDELADAVAARGVLARCEPAIDHAVAWALAQAAPDDLVIVTGSLFVVGETLEAYGPAALAGAAHGRGYEPAP